jgi:hypothetical protein
VQDPGLHPQHIRENANAHLEYKIEKMEKGIKGKTQHYLKLI